MSQSSAAPPPSITSEREPVTPADVDALITNDRLGEAAQALRSVDEATSDKNWTRTLATLATRYQQQNDSAAAAEFFARAVAASENPVAASIATDKRCLLRLAAASALVKAARVDAALEVVLWNLQHDADADRGLAASKVLLTIGAHALAASDAATAHDAYDAARSRLSGDDAAAAQLGYAWSLALLHDRPEQAAEELAAFVDRYPHHADTPRALRACASCLQQASRGEAADRTLTRLLTDWPDSQAAGDAVGSYFAEASTPDKLAAIPEFVLHWVASRVQNDRLDGLTDRMFAAVLLSPVASEDAALWRELAAGLAAADQGGQTVSDLLQHWSDAEHTSDAERLAAMLVSPSESIQPTPTAREAACRWAGRHQHWSLLALATEAQRPGDEDASLTTGVQRLLAEGLMQTGRAAEAYDWWEHLVDVRGANDFPTLLRCAETAVAHAEVAEANQRIQQARSASADEPFRDALLRMLSADLAVRQLNFEEARSLLESVVRFPQEVGPLRARAQWLIGESYFLQQRFAEAVEVYRTVEAIDPDGPWVAPSLVQAGKSFEQLGRTREAAVCYSNLLRQYSDSPHADDARRRLAALSPQGTTSTDTIRR